MDINRELLETEYSRNHFLFVQSKERGDERNQLIQATRLELLGRLLEYKPDKEIFRIVRGIK